MTAEAFTKLPADTFFIAIILDASPSVEMRNSQSQTTDIPQAFSGISTVILLLYITESTATNLNEVEIGSIGIGG